MIVVATEITVIVTGRLIGMTAALIETTMIVTGTAIGITAIDTGKGTGTADRMTASATAPRLVLVGTTNPTAVIVRAEGTEFSVN